MVEIVKPFESYRVRYGATSPAGRDIAQITFFNGQSVVGKMSSGSAIVGLDSLVSLQRDTISLYVDSTMLATLLTILQSESDLALYFVPDPEHPTRGREGGIRTGVVRFRGAVPTATAVAGGAATVAFDTPTPRDDSFTYTVTKATGGGADSPTDLDGDPKVIGNVTTLKLKNLAPAGTKFIFRVTANSKTTDITATSQPSTEITAIA